MELTSEQKDQLGKVSADLMANPKFMEHYNRHSGPGSAVYKGGITLPAEKNIVVSPDGKKISFVTKGKYTAPGEIESQASATVVDIELRNDNKMYVIEKRGSFRGKTLNPAEENVEFDYSCSCIAPNGTELGYIYTVEKTHLGDGDTLLPNLNNTSGHAPHFEDPYLFGMAGSQTLKMGDLVYGEAMMVKCERSESKPEIMTAVKGTYQGQFLGSYKDVTAYAMNSKYDEDTSKLHIVDPHEFDALKNDTYAWDLSPYVADNSNRAYSSYQEFEEATLSASNDKSTSR